MCREHNHSSNTGSRWSNIVVLCTFWKDTSSDLKCAGEAWLEATMAATIAAAIRPARIAEVAFRVLRTGT